MVRFRPFEPGDVVAIDLQPSQRTSTEQLALPMSLEYGEQIAASGPAWTALDADGRILCCAGIGTVFPGHGVAWALLSANVGAAHVSITRFARALIAQCEYRRIEALVDAANDRACRWAELVGLVPSPHPLRNWGPACDTRILFERIR